MLFLSVIIYQHYKQEQLKFYQIHVFYIFQLVLNVCFLQNDDLLQNMLRLYQLKLFILCLYEHHLDNQILLPQY